MYIHTQVTADGMTQTHTTELPSYLYRPGAAVCDLQDFQYTTQAQNEEVSLSASVYEFREFISSRFILLTQVV